MAKLEGVERTSMLMAVEQAANRVAALEGIDFDALSDEELVTAYRLLNRMKNGAESARNRARDVTVERIKSYAEEAETGELNLSDRAPEYLAQSGDGVLRMENDAGDGVELRPRTKTQFLENVAREILAEKHLLEFAVERETVVTDPEGLRQAFESVQERLVQLGEAELAQKMEEALKAATDVRESVSQAKIESLVKRGKLSADDVERMFNVSVTYALYA